MRVGWFNTLEAAETKQPATAVECRYRYQLHHERPGGMYRLHRHHLGLVHGRAATIEPLDHVWQREIALPTPTPTPTPSKKRVKLRFSACPSSMTSTIRMFTHLPVRPADRMASSLRAISSVHSADVALGYELPALQKGRQRAIETCSYVNI